MSRLLSPPRRSYPQRNNSMVESTNVGGRPRERRGPRGAFAESLRSARAQRRWSQTQAAADLGVPQSTYAAWESGGRRPGHLARRYLEEVWVPKLWRKKS